MTFLLKYSNAFCESERQTSTGEVSLSIREFASKNNVKRRRKSHSRIYVQQIILAELYTLHTIISGLMCCAG